MKRQHITIDELPKQVRAAVLHANGRPVEISMPRARPDRMLLDAGSCFCRLSSRTCVRCCSYARTT